MKDDFSFEDNIKRKMEEFNDVPSAKVWQQLEQNNSSDYLTTQKSFIMKGIIISLVSVAALSLGYLGYHYNNGSEATTTHNETKSEYTTHPKIQAFLDAKEKAEKEGKIIIVKATMEGCTFCGKMEKETYLTTEVQEALDDKFIVLDLDIKDPDYKDFNKYYQIDAAPISLFLNAEGEQLAKVVGAREKDFFLDAVELALEEEIKLKNNIGDRFHDGHGHYQENNWLYFFRNKPTSVDASADAIEEISPKEKAMPNEMSKENPLKLKAYPNPNNGNFKLDIEGIGKEGILYFSDSNGNVFFKEKIDATPYARTLEYDFSNRSNAILLRMEQGGNIATEKIIIQK